MTFNSHLNRKKDAKNRRVAEWLKRRISDSRWLTVVFKTTPLHYLLTSGGTNLKLITCGTVIQVQLAFSTDQYSTRRFLMD